MGFHNTLDRLDCPEKSLFALPSAEKYSLIGVRSSRSDDDLDDVTGGGLFMTLDFLTFRNHNNTTSSGGAEYF